MLPRSLRRRLSATLRNRSVMRAVNIGGGIVAAHYLGVMEPELASRLYEGLQFYASKVPFQEPLALARNYYDGALTYIGSAGLGIADWARETGTALSKHSIEQMDMIRDWAGERTDAMREAFHSRISESRPFRETISRLADSGGSMVSTAWNVATHIGAAWMTVKALQEATEFTMNSVRRISRMMNGEAVAEDDAALPGDNDRVSAVKKPGETPDQPAADNPSIQNLHINLIVSGDPEVLETRGIKVDSEQIESAVRRALTPEETDAVADSGRGAHRKSATGSMSKDADMTANPFLSSDVTDVPREASGLIWCSQSFRDHCGEAFEERLAAKSSSLDRAPLIGSDGTLHMRQNSLRGGSSLVKPKVERETPFDVDSGLLNELRHGVIDPDRQATLPADPFDTVPRRSVLIGPDDDFTP